jgi:hypothetical protein
MHEHTPQHNATVQESSDRTFGLVFAAVFFIIALYPLLQGAAVRGWALAVSGLFLLPAFFFPIILAPANRAWAKLGLLLHRIVSPVALGILFFLVVTPTGLFMRLLGKDLLRLQRDPAVDSYWIRRDPPGPDADSLRNQF